jgi:hypothetical protein
MQQAAKAFSREKAMAFPPNYQQERSNRSRAKQRKAQEKQARREEQSSQRKSAGLADQQSTPAEGGEGDAHHGQEKNQG